VKSHATHAPPANTVAVQLQQAAQALTHAQVATRPPPQNTSPDTSPTAATAASAQVPVKKLKEELAQLESTIAAIPKLPEFADAIANLESKAQKKRLMLREAKPPGARLDASREALKRAMARKVQAVEASRLAQLTVTASEEEIGRLRSDIQRIEVEIEVTVEQTPRLAYQAMTDALDNMLSVAMEMPGYSEEHISQARLHIDGLAAGFRKTMESAVKVAEAVDLAASRPSPRRWKLSGKQRPSAAYASPDGDGDATMLLPDDMTTPIRIRSKSAPATGRLITDFFAPVKKPRLTVATASIVPGAADVPDMPVTP
jgi:hypothetical protein